jgi:ribosome-associated translation inhibitor RaiA
MTKFAFEYKTEIDDPEGVLRLTAERRLQDLASGHRDMIGALVTLEELTANTTPHVYKATVVAYVSPENLAATKQAASAQLALSQAIAAVERQVREQRDRLRESRR